MILLGIIIILLSVLAGLGGLWMTTSNNATIAFSLGPMAVNVTPAVLFVSGMIVVAMLGLGLWLARSGTRRSMDRRRERKQLERDARAQEKQLAETRARLGQTRGEAQEAERHREEERIRDAKLRVEADRRRESGREEEIRRTAARKHGHDAAYDSGHDSGHDSAYDAPRVDGSRADGLRPGGATPADAPRRDAPPDPPAAPRRP